VCVLQASIRRYVPAGHCFKGFPTCFNHSNSDQIARAVLDRSTKAAADVVTSRGDYVRFGLRAKVTAYPEDMLAAWVMIAVRCQPLE
jgi:hypothetical protein